MYLHTVYYTYTTTFLTNSWYMVQSHTWSRVWKNVYIGTTSDVVSSMVQKNSRGAYTIRRRKKTINIQQQRQKYN